MREPSKPPAAATSQTPATRPAAAPAAASVRVPAGPLRPLLLPLTRLAEWLAMALLVAATTLIIMEVLSRGLLNRALPWADELARYCGLGIIFLTVPLLLARDGHVKVDLLFDRLKGGPRRAVTVLNEGLILAFCVFFLVACYGFMQRAGRFSTPALSIPNLVYYLPAIVGMALMTLVAADRTIGAVLGRSMPASTGSSASADSRPPTC